MIEHHIGDLHSHVETSLRLQNECAFDLSQLREGLVNPFCVWMNEMRLLPATRPAPGITVNEVQDEVQDIHKILTVSIGDSFLG